LLGGVVGSLDPCGLERKWEPGCSGLVPGVARHADQTEPVAEVALDLPGDRRRCIRAERDAAPRVEPVDRLDQAESPHLDEILERLAAVDESARDCTDEWEVLLDQDAPPLICAGNRHRLSIRGRPSNDKTLFYLGTAQHDRIQN